MINPLKRKPAELDAEDITPPNADPEFVKLRDTVAAMETAKARIVADIAKIEKGLADTEAQERRREFLIENGADPKILPASAASTIATLKDGLAKKVRALRGADDEIAAQRIAVHAATKDAHLKVQRKLNNAKLKYAQQVSDGFAMALEGLEKLTEFEQRNLISWPSAIAGRMPGGTLANQAEMRAALLGELYRLASPNLRRTEVFPGLAPHLHPAPKALAERLEHTGAFLLKRLETPPDRPRAVASTQPLPSSVEQVPGAEPVASQSAPMPLEGNFNSPKSLSV